MAALTFALALWGAAMKTAMAQENRVPPHIRGFWVDGFNEGIKTPEQVDELIRRVQEANGNAIFAQVRKRGDAYYWSRYEPRARDFDTLSYDPLAYLIEKAHAANPRIQVHAWINMGAVGPPGNSEHILAKHPDWRSLSDTGEGDDKEAVKIDPGVPGAADWTFRVYLDVLRQYDVDGIHFDFVRYGGAKWGYAPESVARFNARYDRTGKPAFDDPLWQGWRREQVSNLVRKVYVHAAAVKPSVIVSAATISWGDGPRTTEDWLQSSAYREVFQDWRDWLQTGILDLACPMTYFRKTPHESFQRNWANWVKNHQYNRAATLATAAYLNDLESTLELARINLSPTPDGETPAGILFYSYGKVSTVPEERDAFFQRLRTVFPEPVAFPELPWKTNPTTGHIKGFVRFGSELAAADGATVVLTPLGAPRSTTRLTDGTGFFAFANLPPGEYDVYVEFQGERTRTLRILVAAGVVHDAHFRLSDGDLPLPHPVRGISDLRDGQPVLLEDRVVTVGSSRLGTGGCYIADGFGEFPVAVRWEKPLLLPLVYGDRVTLTGTVRFANGRPYIQADAVVFSGMAP